MLLKSDSEEKIFEKPTVIVMCYYYYLRTDVVVKAFGIGILIESYDQEVIVN